jgi:hypothetical protein
LKTASGNEFNGELRIDPLQSPKQPDFHHEKTGVVWPAICSVDDETFRPNYVEAGGRDLGRRCLRRHPIRPARSAS